METFKDFAPGKRSPKHFLTLDSLWWPRFLDKLETPVLPDLTIT